METKKTKKILLFHGWNWKNYTKFCPKGTNPWHDREVFIKTLKQNGFDLVTPAFPGFCGEKEPLDSWFLSDFEKMIETYFQTEKPDAIIGYSFGGAAVLSWAEKYNHPVPIVLISPAITRKYSVKNPNLMVKFSKLLPTRITSFLRNIYLTMYVKNPFHIHGTKFLRETYRNIITIDLVEKLKKMDPKNILLIYGSIDTATPPDLIKQKLSNSNFLDSILVIDGASHDLVNSHHELVLKKISSFLKT